jgi:hypothetical protein
VNAVTATANGWVAVGAHGNSATIWASADGRHWKPSDMQVPNGASAASLRMVAVNGTRVVAAGNAVTRAGNLPIFVVSADNGGHWQQIVFSASDGLGTVTALTAAGNGFVAAGQVESDGAQRTVAWGSPDGSSWSAATPLGSGTGEVTALTASGGAATGTTEQATGPAVLTLPAP